MTRARLHGVHGTYETDPYGRSNEPQYGWTGRMRIVRSRKRMRKLRRRGEEIIDTGERSSTGRKVFAWFIEHPASSQPLASPGASA